MNSNEKTRNMYPSKHFKKINNPVSFLAHEKIYSENLLFLSHDYVYLT